jgi:hypothetical protein
LNDPRRKLALSIARTLQQNLWFHEVDFDHHVLKDDDFGSGGINHQVYTFLFADDAVGTTGEYGRGVSSNGDESRGGSRGEGNEEIPTGVITSLTRCESLVCTKENAEGGLVYDELDPSVVVGVRGGCYSFDCPNRPKVNLFLFLLFSRFIC